MSRSLVFISYSHKNKRDLEMVRKHLAPLEERLLIWDDRSIAPGAKWRQAIQEALASAKVAVLLVNAEFLASQFITQEELPVLVKAAEAGEILLFALVLNPCLIEDTPLVPFQTNDQPLKLMSTKKRKEFLSRIAKQIKGCLGKPLKPEIQEKEPRGEVG